MPEHRNTEQNVVWRSYLVKCRASQITDLKKALVSQTRHYTHLRTRVEEASDGCCVFL